jgi:hypothetical protein
MATPHHSFDIVLAAEYGIEGAILIHHFQHWIGVNRRLKRNFFDGKTWSYQTHQEIYANFPYWSPDKVRRYVDSLVDAGVLLKGNFNKCTFDRTLWYAFVDEERFSNNFYERQNCQMEDEEVPLPFGENARPIPDTNPYPKPEEPVCNAPPVASHDAKKKERESKKEEATERALNALKMPSECSKQHPDGHYQTIRLQDIFEASVSKRKDWSTDEIHDAWKVLLEQNDQIRDPLRYLEGIITKIRNFKKADYLTKQKESTWKETKKQNESENCNANSSENDTVGLISLGSLWEKIQAERSLNGLKEAKTS